MVTKLIKYDLRDMLKSLSVFYILTIIFAILARIFTELSDIAGFFKIISIIFSSIEYGLIINIIINSLIRIFVRFSKVIYGDESYLTHTLPVTKKDLILSKFLSGIIVILIGFIIMIISLIILFMSKTFMLTIDNLLSAILVGYKGNAGLILFVFLLLIILEFCTIMAMVLTAIIMGNRSKEKRLLKTFLWLGLLYLINIIDLLISITLYALITKNVDILFSSNEVMPVNFIIGLGIVCSIVYLIYIICFYIISRFQLDKGVNID